MASFYSLKSFVVLLPLGRQHIASGAFWLYLVTTGRILAWVALCMCFLRKFRVIRIKRASVKHVDGGCSGVWLGYAFKRADGLPVPMISCVYAYGSVIYKFSKRITDTDPSGSGCPWGLCFIPDDAHRASNAVYIT